MLVEIFARLRSQDPMYGSQKHQRDFLVRMELLQLTTPCTKDHSQVPDPCTTCTKVKLEHHPVHHSHCYPSCGCNVLIGIGCRHHPINQAHLAQARAVVEALLGGPISWE